MFNWFKKTALAVKGEPTLDVAAIQGGNSITQLEMSESETLRKQGNAHLSNGKLEEAAECFRQAIALNPRYAEAYTNLGLVFQMQGNLDEAVALYHKAVVFKPDLLPAHLNLGNSLIELGQIDEAEDILHRVIAVAPEHHGALQSLGLIAAQRGDFSLAETMLRRALELQPNYVEAHTNLGNFLRHLNRLDEAEASYRRALQINPNYVVAHNNLIFTLDMKVDVDTASLQEERKQWNTVHAAHLHQQRAHFNIPDPERRLRIGYVSADFREHSAAYVFGTMLVNFDPDRFDVFAYSNSTKEDALTQHFKQSVTCWRKIVGLSDDTVADLIRKDEIDILVDLSGHSADNRLLVFARKPAPIQITAWGYATGTGLSAMDVFFADPIVVPPEEKHLYTEQVRYLPNVVGSFFLHPCPPVNTLPALSTKWITFGSFNRLVKNSEAAYRVWAQILLAIPYTRMIIKTPELGDASMRERVAGHFTRAGIAPERIILQGNTPHDEHLAAFNQIDIALDPFPHGGGVTALEGLMMGVPMITLRWPTLVGRLSASIMTTLGLTDWIAETQEDYVELAIQKVKDLQSLAALRQQLPGIFTLSIIGDQVTYTRAVEKEYRQLWKDWVSSCSLKGGAI